MEISSVTAPQTIRTRYYKVKFSVSHALPAQPAREFERVPNTAQYCPIELNRRQTTAQLRASQAIRGWNASDLTPPLYLSFVRRVMPPVYSRPGELCVTCRNGIGVLVRSRKTENFTL